MDKSAHNGDLLALFFGWERFMMAALNDLLKCGFRLPRRTYDFLGAWSLRPVSVEQVCLKEYLLFVNLRLIQEPLTLKQVFPFTRLMKFSLFINGYMTGSVIPKLKSPKTTLSSKKSE